MNKSLVRFEFEKSPLHTIVYGATGTGKTYFVRQYLKLYQRSCFTDQQSCFADQDQEQDKDMMEQDKDMMEQDNTDMMEQDNKDMMEGPPALVPQQKQKHQGLRTWFSNKIKST